MAPPVAIPWTLLGTRPSCTILRSAFLVTSWQVAEAKGVRIEGLEWAEEVPGVFGKAQ